MIELLGLNPTEWNEWRLIFLASWPSWLLWLLAVALPINLWLGYRIIQSASPKRKFILLGLRFLALLVVGLLFLMPGVELSNVTRSRADVIVLLDDSASMKLPIEADKSSRSSAVFSFLETSKAFLGKIAETHPLVPLRFSEAIETTTLDKEPSAFGTSTYIRESLLEILNQYQDKDLGGILLFSDGIDNGLFGKSTPALLEHDAVLASLAARNTPVHVFLAGREGALRDLAISAVNVDEFAFLHNATEVELQLRSQAMHELQSTEVSLKKGAETISSKVATFHDGTATIKFRLVPDKLGKAVYALEVPLYPGEAVTENNRYEFVIKVIRDKIRVLQVCGRPSYDERFLRDLFKRDPNVDLISLFILRGSLDLQPVPQEEISLIPFPTKETFGEELPSFDLVIFQNFDYAPYGVAPYLGQIKSYVQGGGAFVMLGGDLSFSQGGYDMTPVEEILPVSLGPIFFDENGESAGLSTEEFQPLPTEQGLLHPITSFGLPPSEAQERWKTLPQLEGINLVEGVSPGAVILARQTASQNGEQGAPVIAVGEFEKGRSLAVLTDTLWRWDFTASAQGESNNAYRDFWKNATRWLLRDPSLKSLRISVDKDRYSLGETVRVQVRAFQADYRPSAQLSVSVSVGLARDKTRETLSLTTDENGIAFYEYKPTQTGAFVLDASAKIDGKDMSDSEVFVVQSVGDELRQINVQASLLKTIAQKTGGNFYQLPTTLSAKDASTLPLLPPKVLKVNRRKEEPLWASTPFLLLPIALLCLEWWLRRRWGYS